MPKHQFALSLIHHEVNNSLIEQRAGDGYINATQLCTAAGKHWNQYLAPDPTRNFMRALFAKTQMNAVQLCPEVIDENGNKNVWVHPKIAIHLAQWLSADFALQVSEWVFDWLTCKDSQKSPRNNLPYHIQRHMLNLNRIPAGYFSVLQEMTFILIAPLDQLGYELPEKMLPDISMGRFLCKHLRDQIGIDTDTLPVYVHHFPDGRNVEAKLYPNKYLAEFRRIIQEEWIVNRAADYFNGRDPQALPYLDKVILALPGPLTAMNDACISKKKRNK